MFGVDDLIIAGIAAMVAGAAAQQYGAAQQSRKASNLANQALLMQRRQTDEAQKKVMDVAQQYDTDTTNKQLADTAEQLSDQYAAPVSEEQKIRASQQGTSGYLSNDYKNAKASSDESDLSYVKNLASLMGNVNASGRLRMNQGFNLARAAQDITQANKFNAMDNATNIADIQATANASNGWQTGGGILQGLGTVLATYGAGSALMAPAAAGSTAAGSSAAASGFGLSSAAGGTGVGRLAAKAGSTLPALASSAPSSSWLYALGSAARTGYGLKGNKYI